MFAAGNNEERGGHGSFRGLEIGKEKRNQRNANDEEIGRKEEDGGTARYCPQERGLQKGTRILLFIFIV